MIDNIIISCNEDKNYVGFWPHVAKAYKKLFPNVKVRLAFLTNRKEGDPLVEEFKKHGEVTLYEPLSYIPEWAQAKMIRFVLASELEDEVSYIDDIDLFPLTKEFITDKTDKRPKDHLLCVGGEVYKNAPPEQAGTYPVSQMTAEGHVWKKFVNPKDLDWPNLMESWVEMSKTIKFSPKEDPMIRMDMANDAYFSDERLMKRLIIENPVPKFELERGYEATVEGILDATLDRMNWAIDEEKLKRGEYQNAHGPRPFDIRDYQPLIDYIDKL